MFVEGQLLRFNSFAFKNGAQPKAKYFLVLRRIGEELVMASLPTSKDHVPDSDSKTGCVNIPERCLSAFVFAAGGKVNDNFAFPLRTFIYGEQVDEYNESYLNAMSGGFVDLGLLNESLFAALFECLKQSSVIKRKYARLL